jgi:CheY-specific phosphatase CheX
MFSLELWREPVFEEIRAAAISATSKVFETMFFIPLELQDKSGEEEPVLLESQGIFKGEIGFHGKHSGQLRLYLPSSLADMMVCNFMGLEEGKATESQTIDMVNELCNMICGNLFSQLDRKLVWDLTTPRSQFISYQEMESEMTPEAAVALDLIAEGFSVKLAIQFET